MEFCIIRIYVTSLVVGTAVLQSRGSGFIVWQVINLKHNRNTRNLSALRSMAHDHYLRVEILTKFRVGGKEENSTDSKIFRWALQINFFNGGQAQWVKCIGKKPHVSAKYIKKKTITFQRDFIVVFFFSTKIK